MIQLIFHLQKYPFRRTQRYKKALILHISQIKIKNNEEKPTIICPTQPKPE